MSFELVDRAPFGRRREITRWRAPNGLTLLLLPDPETTVFAYHTWFAVGSRHERVGRTGMAHLFEHLMFKATSNVPEGDFDRIMEARGAQTNAATWVDWTYYYEVLPAIGDNLETAVRLEADRMEHMVLDSAQLEAEREVVKNERRYRVDDDPDGRMFEELYRLALDGHPYGWPTIGWMSDIEAITLEDCLSFYRRHYAPDSAVIVAAGKVDPDEVLRLVDAHYGHMEAQAASTPDPKDLSPIVSARRLELALPVQSERLLMGYRSPAQMSADLPALDVAMEILFGGESGRLQQKLVNELEVASSVSGWASHFRFPGLAEIGITLRSGVTAEAVEAVVLAGLAELAATPPPVAEVAKIQNQAEAAHYRGLSTANAQAGRLGHYEVTTGDYRHFLTAVDRILAVRPEDVSRAVSKWLRPDGRSCLVARPG